MMMTMMMMDKDVDEDVDQDVDEAKAEDEVEVHHRADKETIDDCIWLPKAYVFASWLRPTDEWTDRQPNIEMRGRI